MPGLRLVLGVTCLAAVAMAPVVPGPAAPTTEGVVAAVAPGAGPGDVPVLACHLPGIDDRCESWAVVDDPQPDAEEPYQQPSALAVSPDGGFVAVAGYGAQDLFDTGGQADSRWRVLALDAATGEQRWLARPGPSGSYARPLDVGFGRDGSMVLVTGYAASAFGQRDASLVVAALDATTGELLWEQAVDAGDVGRGATDVRGWYVAEAADGQVVVAGTYGRAHPGGFQGVLTAVLDGAQGTLLDVVVAPGIPAGGTAYPGGLELTADGRTAVVGATSDGVGTYNIDMMAFGVALDGPGAARLAWSRRWDGRGNAAPDRLEAMAATADGARVLLTGISGNDADGPPFDADYDVATLALDGTSGELVWTSRLAFAADGFAPPVGIDERDGEVVLAVNRTGESGTAEVGVVTLSTADGRTVRDVGVPAATLEAEGVNDIAWAEDEVVLTGRGPSTTNAATGSYLTRADAVTAGIDPATGTRLWSARYSTSVDADDRGLALATGPDGGVYVLGAVTNGVDVDENFYDLSVLAYRRG